MQVKDEDQLLRASALQNVQSILLARQRAEQELIQTKEALEEETRFLNLLNETGAMLASKLDLQIILQTVIDATTQLSGARFGAFFYTTKPRDDSARTLHAVSGAPPEVFQRFAIPRSAPTRIADVQEDPRYASLALDPDLNTGQLSIRSYLAVPVTARSGEVIGGLFFGHPQPNVFGERSERLVVGIAAQAANAIDNARLYDEAKRAAEERARLLDAERATRAELERVSLLKDEFLATLSHELRTPLNAVLGWSEILISRCDDPAAVASGLETILRNARAQAQLIEDLLDMNRIISGKIRLDVQRADLVHIVEAALDSVRPSVDAKSITLRSIIDPKAGAVLGDPNRLQQVVWNLLNNAVKFTPKGGKIHVAVQRVNSHVEISIHDSGIGISAEFLPHLFERFRQADARTTRKFGGLGLGLSIVKQLVELHGGTVRALSEGEGRGATFIVNLPLRAVNEGRDSRGEHPATAKPRGEGAPEISLAGLNVLVVDDEQDARELVDLVLTEAGATVCVAAGAAEAEAFVRSKRFDVIVSDIGMPERDGYQFIREVRRLEAESGRKVPAIALTAFARSEDRTRAMLAGFQVHMSKPIEPQELLATIKSLADRPGERAR